MLATKGLRFPLDIVLVCIRWYAAYPLSYRHIEEMMAERGIHVDHSTLNRWVVRLAPQLEKVFQSRRRSRGLSWRMDETYIKVRGTWKYLYRAVAKAGQTVDFLLAARRTVNAAFRFFSKAIADQTEPVKINIDKSGSNTSAINAYNYENGTYIEIRQNKYLNNLVEQDHRFIKKLVNPCSTAIFNVYEFIDDLMQL